MRTRFKPIAAKDSSEPVTLTKEEARVARNSFRASVIAALLATGISIINLLAFYNDGIISPTAIATLFVTVLAYIALWFSLQTNRGTFAITLIIFGLLASQGVSVFLQEGVGVLRGLLVFIINTFLAAYALPHKDMPRWIFINIGSGMLLVLADVFWPFTRTPTAQLAINNSILAIVIAVMVMAVLITREFNAYPLRAKFILVFLPLTVIPIIGLGYINNNTLQQTLTANTQQKLISSSEQTANSVDEFIENNLIAVEAEAQLPQFVNYIALHPSVRTSSLQEREVFGLMSAFAKRDQTYIFSYAILDSNGQKLLTSNPTETGKDESTTSYFQRAMSFNKAIISPIEFLNDTNVAYLYFSAPIHGPSGATLGVLRIRYNAQVLQKLIRHDNDFAGSGSFAVLLDENHLRLADGIDAANTLYRTVRPLDLSRINALKAARRLPLAYNEQSATNIPQFEAGLINAERDTLFNTPLSIFNNKLASAAVVKLKNQPWFLVTFISNETFTAPANTQARNITLIGVAFIVVVFASALFMAQNLADPVVRLTQVATQIQSGNLSLQAPIETGDEVGDLARAFNSMTTRLSELVGSLEQRVADRTKALAASAEVSRRLSTILDRATLINAVVEEVQRAFDYYHAHIYLFDEAEENLIMMGGTGDVGRLMLGRGHKIPKGRGVVGRAAEGGVPVLVPDTALDPNWLPNVLLPDTKSEVAVPIQVGEQILGVLDVQHNIKYGLTKDDADLLQAIANQVGTALQNAQSYSQTQRRVEVETLVNTINRKIQSATSIESVLQTAARELSQALGAPRTRVQVQKSKANSTISKS